jgi:hypothetical protein
MDLPLTVKGLTAMRLGVGLTAIAAPSAFSFVFDLPRAEARTPTAMMGYAFFGVRELTIAGCTVGATATEPRSLRRVLLACAATDGLDLAVLGLQALRRPALRRAVLLFGPGAALSVLLHLRAARNVEVAR